MCSRVGLLNRDLEDLTIGMCIDFIDEYIEQTTPNKQKARKATQEDFDKF